MTLELEEIPDPINMAGWKQIPIKECHEPLIELNNLDPRIEVSPEYYRQEIPYASSIQRLRQKATEALIQAAHLLPEGLKLVVFDAHRPLPVQKSLFDTQVAALKREHPGWSQERLEEESQRYVSIPSSDPAKPSPHSTGGAVDLTILGENGRSPKMGTSFDHFGIEAQTAHFKNSPMDEEIHTNRRLLYTVMTLAGFTNYPEEWWHFDYGNQFWGKVKSRDAFYGLAKLDELNGPVQNTVDPAANAVYIRLKANSPLQTKGRRLGIAGSEDKIRTALDALDNLHHPHFGIKQQLAWVILKQHGLVIFDR